MAIAKPPTKMKTIMTAVAFGDEFADVVNVPDDIWLRLSFGMDQTAIIEINGTSVPDGIKADAGIVIFILTPGSTFRVRAASTAGTMNACIQPLPPGFVPI